MLKSQLWFKVTIALIAGSTAGILLSLIPGWKSSDISAVLIGFLRLPSELFLILIQMVVMPLILTSITLGISGAVGSHLKKIAAVTLIFVGLTTFLAAIVGVSLAQWLQPGVLLGAALKNTLVSGVPLPKIGEVGGFKFSPEHILSLFPHNPLASIVHGQMLQVVVFSIFFGIAINVSKPEIVKPVITLLKSLQEICFKIIQWAMSLAPVAVFGSTASITTEVGWQALKGMSAYVGTAYLGYTICLFGYGFVLILFTRLNPWKFLKAAKEPQLLAFSMASSAAVMPVTLQVTEEKLNVPKSIAQFVIPVGTTINMAGSAVWQSVAVIFLAQAFGAELSNSALITIVVTSVGSSIGSPGVPGVGMGVLAVVLQNMGIPTTAIPLLLGVDRIVDMGCTVVNVTGDLTAAVVVESALKK